jgi:uncharacterized iron-regulated protein
MIKYIFPILLALAGAPNAGEITRADLARLPGADVVILGETHDNAQHHLAQAEAIRALKPAAVVFEMLNAQQAAKITPDLLKDQAALEQALGWRKTGWPDFSLYYPVFSAAKDSKIYGAARPRQQVRAAYKQGAAEAFGPDAAPYGLTSPLPKPQLEQRKQKQFADHCKAMPLEMMGAMVEAQRFRDAAFADTVLQALRKNGAPVVLITGTGHARSDWAVPAMIRKAAPDVSVLSIGLLEKPVTDTPPFDLWLATEPAKREDPCLAFK